MTPVGKGDLCIAVATLTDKAQTTLFLVSRPEESPLKEVERSSNELSDIGIETQHLIINGVLENYDADDSISKQIYERQQNALNSRSAALLKLNTYIVPLRSYNMTGIDNIRNMAEITGFEILSEKVDNENRYCVYVAKKS